MKTTKQINNTEKLVVTISLVRLGEQAPYFSVQGEIYHKSVRGAYGLIACGCIHDEIIKEFPEYQDVLSLHLSSIDGAVVHAVENGWYWLGMTEYQNFDKAFLAKHLRITEEDAQALRERFAYSQNKDEFSAYVDTLRPRWKSEANEAIKKYNLTVESK